MSYLRIIIGNMSVEPVMFLYFFTITFSMCLNTNLLLYKACDPTGAIAQRVGSKCDNETEAQHVVAPINGWKMLSQQLVPIVLVMMAGTWSDRHGRCRRPIIILPIVGQMISDALSVYCSVQWSVSPAVTGVMQAISLSCSGGPSMLFNGINSYIADTTSEESRTTKFGVLGGVITVSGILGMLVYGFVIVNVGFVSAYIVCVCLSFASLVLTFIFIKDVNPVISNNDDGKQISIDKGPLYQEFIRTINPIEVLRNCYHVLTRRRQGHGTTILLLVVLACAPLTCVPLEGEMSIMYLFVRYKFQWNEINYSIFNVYEMSVISLGTIFALGILSHKFKMNDALIGMIASICDILSAVGFLIVSQSWQLYLVAPLEIFRGAALMLTNSLASKCVEPTELGTMNSIKMLTENILKSGFLPLYNFLYNRTFESIPGAFFFISIILTAPLIFVFWLIYFLNQKLNSNSIDAGENRKPTDDIFSIKNSNETNCHI
ncbi:Major facilitator superfamily,Major facilitator superfamily domain [Cinara cedri]|uniref:Major facilitator superfamily,Major facilitator superfamily domain n=1 Tax=Cinara cedri TaxID=506608 RepID=A0A5E4NF38_9HEMI|nr:Major facilitator superfamily,Major facilitator superfamily domain [Cinara cedri]